MNENDLIRLKHMLEAAHETLDYIGDETRESFENDRKLIRALTTTIGIIGEAASRVSREFQDANPQIPWPQIIAMRNRLIHAYFDVNLNLLWDSATKAVPILIAELEKLIPPEE
jgi:uncharacterized protein with HEPN domain